MHQSIHIMLPLWSFPVRARRFYSAVHLLKPDFLRKGKHIELEHSITLSTRLHVKLILLK